ncbi:post-GPI attachment to proteins factor 6-like [Diprion similis]|uniref:post-GPI attachment to proteins factor 6-like n=1 Tax=Diprion similis TaxID=362088 RepID=UPI001EF799EC|nr:post-GPI attachment to proteins factor 6-like [Diprion similis]
MEVQTLTCLLVVMVLALLHMSSSELEKIGRLPATTLVKFHAYRHVSIIHFKIPLDIALARWKFHANEVKTGGIFRCSPQDITVHIKPGSIPFVNPDKSKLPVSLLKARIPHYSLFFTSDGTQQVQNISAPVPGDWFAIAFRSWSDPDDGKIEQQEHFS